MLTRGATTEWRENMNPAFLEILLGTMAFFTFVMAARSEVNGGERKPTSHALEYQRNAASTES
jgi:hypothetical protein